MVQIYGQDSYGLIMGPAEGTCERSKINIQGPYNIDSSLHN